MTNTKLFAAAAVMTSIISTPVFAQGMAEQSKNTAKAKYQQTKNPSMRTSDQRMTRDRSAEMRYDGGYDNRGNSGFLPLDVATGVTAGAIGTAGAIAAAPFGGLNNGYAYNNGWDNRYDRVSYQDRGYRTGYRDSFASTNGFAPGGALSTGPNERSYRVNRIGATTGVFGQTYAQRNGFVCEPGTVFTNVNGIRTLCQ